MLILEAFGDLYGRFEYQRLSMFRRPRVIRADTAFRPSRPINVSLIVDLTSGISFGWTILGDWNHVRWSISSSQDWTRRYPRDGWSAMRETQREAVDLSSFAALLVESADELMEMARTIDFESAERLTDA